MNPLFNTEQESFIKNNVKGIGNKELTDLINKKFRLSVSVQQIKTWKKNHNLSSGITGRFEKGSVPHNKGKKMKSVGRMKETQFKPGQKPLNYKPVGTERIDNKDGYTIIKVKDDGPWHERWRPKHKVLWESVNGPVPKGHVVIFLDRDKTNITLKNLMLVTRNELVRLNQNGWIFDNAEATTAGITLAKIKIQTKKRRGGSMDGKNEVENQEEKTSIRTKGN